MLLAVKYCLVKMCYAPALGNIEIKFFGKLFCCFACNGISPGPEGYHEVSCLIKYHISVHHGREADACEPLYTYAVFFLYVLFKICITVLKSCPDVIERVCPYTVLESVFPFMSALCYGVVVFIYKYCLDPGRTKLNTQYTFSAFDTFCCIHFKFLLNLF